MVTATGCVCCPAPAVVVARDAWDGDEAPMCQGCADEHLLATDGRVTAVRLIPTPPAGP